MAPAFLVETGAAQLAAAESSQSGTEEQAAQPEPGSGSPQPSPAQTAPAQKSHPLVEAFLKKAEELIFDQNYDSKASTHYMVETDDPRLNVEEAVALLESLRSHFDAFWSDRIELRPYEARSQIFLFYSRFKYKQLLEEVEPSGGISVVGHYRPFFDVIAVHTDTVGLGNLPDVLVHEAAHQLVQMLLYGPDGLVTPWMGEGLASYFGHMLRDDSGTFHPQKVGAKGSVLFRKLPREGRGLGRERLRSYRKISKRGNAKPIGEIVSAMDPAAFYGPGIDEHYQASWLLVHFLLHSNDGALTPGFARYLQHEIDGLPGAHTFFQDIGMSPEELDDAFREYVRRFKGR